MGNAQSEEGSKVELGYHVLQVQQGGPGEAAGLKSFFDFIISAQGVPLEKEDATFVDILKNNIGKPVTLTVYNTKTEKNRECVMIPSNTWGGAGLAGITIRFCSYEHINDHVWHVLDVSPNSPASRAGLETNTDYIVGTPDIIFNDSEDFFAMVSSNEGKAMALYVYSTLTDNIRAVHITPNSNWGGSGSLGCDVGYGYLHRIPKGYVAPTNTQSMHPQYVAPTFQSQPFPQSQPHLQFQNPQQLPVHSQLQPQHQLHPQPQLQSESQAQFQPPVSTNQSQLPIGTYQISQQQQSSAVASTNAMASQQPVPSSQTPHSPTSRPISSVPFPNQAPYQQYPFPQTQPQFQPQPQLQPQSQSQFQFQFQPNQYAPYQNPAPITQNTSGSTVKSSPPLSPVASSSAVPIAPSIPSADKDK